MTSFQNFLISNSSVILPGGFGTELQRRGYNTSLPLWSAQANLDAFDLVADIHRDYFKAGADIATTNTFRTTPRTYKKIGKEELAREASAKSVEAARLACNEVEHRPTFVAGSIAPLEDCYEPALTPSDIEFETEHAQLAEWFKEDGVDVIFIETANSLKEATYMAKGASETGLPFMISFLVNKDGSLWLDKTPMADVLKATDLPGRIAVGLNCRPVDILSHAFPVLKSFCGDLPICLYANGYGQPHDDLGWIFDEGSDNLSSYAQSALKWNEQGAKIVGGCCGTTPEYIRAMVEALKSTGVYQR